MNSIIAFPVGNQNLHIEVESVAAKDASGIAKAGIASTIADQVFLAKQSLRDALAAALGANVQAFASSIASLASRPSEWSVEFGLKVTGDLGNIVVAKLSGEANYTVKLTWKDSPQQS